jgi:hypothetical protein
MRIQSTPTLIWGSRSEENEKRIRIDDLKEEIVEKCRGMYDEMEEKFGGIQNSLGKRQQKTEQTLRLLQSRQTECATSYAGLASRIDQIDEERNIFTGDLRSIKNDVDGELPTTMRKRKKTYQSLLALFENFQGCLENDSGHSHMDSFGSSVLSDELRRAEATSGLCRLSGKLLILWETVNLPHLRLLLANVRVLFGIVFLRLSTFLYLITRSFDIHPFLASFNSTIVSAIDPLTYFCCFLPKFYTRFSMVSLFNVRCNLSIGPLPQRILFQLLPLILITIFLIHFLLMFPGRAGGLEPHVVPRKLRRIQKNIRYHSGSDL